MSTQAEQLRAASVAIWERSRPQVDERVATVERAVVGLLEGRLVEDDRQAAQRAAHQLAGTAGTFGFQAASELAHDLEDLLAAPVCDAAAVARAAALVERMREALDDEEAPSGGCPAAAGPRVVLVTSCPARARDVGAAARSRGMLVEAAQDLDAAAGLVAHGGVDAVLVICDAPVHPAAAEALRRLAAVDPSCLLVLAGADLGTNERLLAAQAGVREFADAQEPAPALLEAVTRGLRRNRPDAATVLVVDDDPLLLAGVSELLAPTEMRAVTLGDPMKLWEVLAAETPDVLVLDVDMPGADGLQLCRLLRSDDRWRHVPLVFLSAQSPDRVAQLYAAGADDFVAKPVGPQLVSRLRNRLERARLLAPGGPGEDRHSRAGDPRATCVDVVVVEDDGAVASLLARAAESAGFSCLVIGDGQEAVDRLAGPHAPVAARTVLLDVDLPSRNGVEVLRSLRASGVLRRTTVLMVSGRSTEHDVTQALAEGASDHIAKPFSLPVLAHKLRHSVATRR